MVDRHVDAMEQKLGNARPDLLVLRDERQDKVHRHTLEEVCRYVLKPVFRKHPEHVPDGLR